MPTGLLSAALFAFAVLIPLGAAAVRRPQFGVLLLSALLPYDGLLLLIDLPPIVNGWKEGAVIAILLAAIASRYGEKPAPLRALPGYWMSAGALFGLGLLSFMTDPGWGALGGLKVGYFYLLLPIALWLAPLNRKETDHLVTIFMVNGFVTSLVGIAQQVVGDEFLNSIGYEYNSQIRFSLGIMRSFSTFVQPFPFAFYLMIVLLVGIPIVLTDRDRLRNRLFILASPVLLVGMLTAVVRGAILGLGLGVLYLIITRFRVLSHGAVLVLMGLLLLPGSALGALGSRSSLDERTTGWITEVIDEGVEPFGLGIGKVGAAAEQRLDSLEAQDLVFPSGIADNRYQPDNYYVKTLIELGPVGLWLLLWSVAAAISFAHRTAGASDSLIQPRERALAQGITAATIAAAGAGIVAAYWEIFPVDAFYWLLLGVLPSLLQLSLTPSPSPPVVAEYRPTAANSLGR